MNSRTLISTAAFLAVAAISILAAAASSVAGPEGADGFPYGWQPEAGETRNA
jgi:hypothetical protein